MSLFVVRKNVPKQPIVANGVLAGIGRLVNYNGVRVELMQSKFPCWLQARIFDVGRDVPVAGVVMTIPLVAGVPLRDVVAAPFDIGT